MSMDQKDSGTEFLYEQDKKEKSVGTLILDPFYGPQWHLEATSGETRWSQVVQDFYTNY